MDAMILLVVAGVFLLAIGVVAIIGIVFLVTRKSNAPSQAEVAFLRDEVARLQEENERLKMERKASGSTDIK